MSRKSCILIVDDMPTNINILGSALASDYELRVATSGDAALEVVKQHQPDCVLLDIVMPGLDGYEVCRRLKNNPKTKDIPVIFITAMSEEEDETKGLELGAADYITKPFRTGIVQARVNAVLALKKEMDARMALTRRLEEANRRIMDSIEYARSIQRAFLPRREVIASEIDDHFIIWRPKDIIGGDIFWFKGKDKAFHWAVLDCTGHGVPGAIMTMIAGASLNRVMDDMPGADPGAMLAALNRLIRASLGQRPKKDLSDDGLDMGLCRVDRNAGRIVFSGARIGLYYVDQQPPGLAAVHQVKGDKQSIGYSSSDPDFVYSDTTVELTPGRRFYMTTDGFTDQLGGDKGFSFGRKRFVRFLEEHSKKSFAEQKKLLEETFETYKGNQPQMDDITVIGFEVTDSVGGQ